MSRTPRCLSIPLAVLLCLTCGLGWSLLPGIGTDGSGHESAAAAEPPGLLATNASAPSVNRGIWDTEILPQPFEQEPFRQIRIPDWVAETTGVGYTLSVQTEPQRIRARDAGVTISELGFVDPHFVYYDSRLLKKRSPHVARDFVDREVAHYRRLGIRILGVYPPSLQSEVYVDHPDWRRIATNTREIPSVDLNKTPHGGMLCLLGPYGDFFIEVLAEIAEKYPVDAFSFDGLHYAGVCYCQHCRENFRRETQQEIPNVDMNNLAFRRYQHSADRRLERLIQRMQTRLKSIRPEIALITWTTNAGRFGHFRDIPRNMPARMNLLLDAPDQEFWLDETNRGNTIVPALANAYIWACTNHRVAFSEPYLMSHGNPYGKESFPAHEVLRRVLLAITHGAAPSLAVIQPPPLQAAAYQALQEIARRKPWMVQHRPVPWGGLLLSDNTRVFYGRSSGEVEDRYLSHVFGTYRTVLEEHLPVTMLCDWNLTPQDLAAYRVLVLPNTASLDERQAAAIRQYVEQGGGLVASLDSSLCDEFGTPRKQPLLADLFGLRYDGLIATDPRQTELDVNFERGLPDDYWQKRKQAFTLRIAADSPLLTAPVRELTGTEPLIFKGPAVRVQPLGDVQIAATLQAHGQPEAPVVPAILTRRVGKGRVVYFAAGLDHACYSYAYPYQRELLAAAIRWAARTPPPVEVQAPMCVHATFFQQALDAQGKPVAPRKPITPETPTAVGKPAAGKTAAGEKEAAGESARPERTRLLLHLYNDVNTTAFHALPQDDVPLREETLPIHDIVVRVRDRSIQQAIQQPEGRVLPITREGDETVFTVPKLEIHSVIELQRRSD